MILTQLHIYGCCFKFMFLYSSDIWVKILMVYASVGDGFQVESPISLRWKAWVQVGYVATYVTFKTFSLMMSVCFCCMPVSLFYSSINSCCIAKWATSDNKCHSFQFHSQLLVYYCLIVKLSHLRLATFFSVMSFALCFLSSYPI